MYTCEGIYFLFFICSNGVGCELVNVIHDFLSPISPFITATICQVANVNGIHNPTVSTTTCIVDVVFFHFTSAAWKRNS